MPGAPHGFTDLYTLSGESQEKTGRVGALSHGSLEKNHIEHVCGTKGQALRHELLSRYPLDNSTG